MNQQQNAISFAVARLIIVIIVLTTKGIYSAEFDASPHAIHPQIDPNELVYSVEFYKNKFRSQCHDTGNIRNYNSNIRIRQIDSIDCVVYVDSGFSLQPKGMTPVVNGNLLTLRSLDSKDSLLFNLDDVFAIQQNIKSMKGEPNLAAKTFPIIGGILIPTAILGLLIVVMFIHSGGPVIN